MHARPRLMLNAEQTKIRAIQGHTLDILDLNQLYEKILSVSQFYNHQMWGGNPPDTLVVEISNENYSDNWKRMDTFNPSINEGSYHEGGAGHRPTGFWNIQCYPVHRREYEGALRV